MEERIKTLQEDIHRTAREIVQLKEDLKQKQGRIISMKGGIIELEIIINAQKIIEQKTSNEEE